jgi:hypothetical protein
MATTAPFDTSPAWGCDKYSDLTLRCGKNVFKVHKNIVCTQSKVFAAACDGGFQVSDHIGMAPRGIQLTHPSVGVDHEQHHD